MRVTIASANLAIFFLTGFLISWYSQNFKAEEPVALQMRTQRDPAAIKKVYDFSNLEGSALSFATKKRLLDGAKLIREEKDVGVALGHFVIKGANGEKLFACQNYSKIVLNFDGEGVAVSGELPKMEVEGKCEISADINSISPIWIPVAKIMGEPVGDGEFDFREGRPAKVKFANVSDQWPKMWLLKSVRLVDPNGGNSEVAIQSSELKEILKKPFVVEF